MTERFAEYRAVLRAGLEGFDRDWIEEALTQAAAVPDTGDEHAYQKALVAVVKTVIQARVDALRATVAAQNVNTHAKIKAQPAADAAEAYCHAFPDRGITH